MMNEPQTATSKKECEVQKIENKLASLKGTAADILELSKDIETFLLGPRPLGASEKAVKKEPVGWYQTYWDDLDNVHSTLSYAADCLRSVKNSYT